MRDTLENLYFGNITPNEQDITPGSVLADAMDQAEQCEEKLTARLEGEEKTLLLRLLNAENEICSTMALENYILGFRLRMRIAIEALDEDDGNLTMTQEEGGTYQGQRNGPTEKVTSVSEKTAGGRAGTPPDMIQKLVSGSSKMCWVRHRQRSRKNSRKHSKKPTV